MAILFEALTIPAALGGALLLNVHPWEAFQLDSEGVALGIASTVPLLLLYAALLHSSAEWAREIHARVQEVILPLFRESRVVGVIVVSLLAGVGEELLFRGVLQEGLTQSFGAAAGLVGASVLFGAAHWITPAYALLATGMGLYLGGLYLWSGNLLVPMLAHALYDFIALRYYLTRVAPAEDEHPAP